MTPEDDRCRLAWAPVQGLLFLVECLHALLLAFSATWTACFLIEPHAETVGDAIVFSEGIAIEASFWVIGLAISVLAIAVGRRSVRLIASANVVLTVIWAIIVFFGTHGAQSL